MIGQSTAVKMQSDIENGSAVFVNGDPSGIVDAHGKPVKKGGWMARLDEKGGKEVTLRQSSVVFLTVAPAILTLIVALLISWAGFIRGDENTRVNQSVMQDQIKETRSDVKEMKDGFQGMKDQTKDLLHAVELLNAKVASYGLGNGDGKAGHPPEQK